MVTTVSTVQEIFSQTTVNGPMVLRLWQIRFTAWALNLVWLTPFLAFTMFQGRLAYYAIGLYGDSGTKTCAGYPGSQGYETQDAKLLASWGVDYWKYDNVNEP